MRDWWYGDKRDVVKWGSICVLAQKRSIRTVLQVAFYRPESRNYHLSMDGTAEPLPTGVIQHFRNIDHIQRLAAKADLRIDIHKDLFQWSCEFRTRSDFRKAYFNGVRSRITQYSEAIIVFLDPDTGIAPANYGYEHITHQEIQTVLGAMKTSDVLLLYQHARQGDRDWLNSARQEFCQAVGPDVPVETITCSAIASDVVFFMVERSKCKWADA
jgi:hypothetical protein